LNKETDKNYPDRKPAVENLSPSVQYIGRL